MVKRKRKNIRKERTNPQSEWMAKKCPYFDGINQYEKPVTECIMIMKDALL